MRAVFSKSLRLTLVQFSMSETSVFKEINWTGGQILPLISIDPQIKNILSGSLKPVLGVDCLWVDMTKFNVQPASLHIT